MFRSNTTREKAKDNTAPPSAVGPIASDTPMETTPVVEVREVSDAAIAADLFRRKFGQEIPKFPKHFVAMIGDQCAGYVHYTPWQGDYLGGGLCIDDRIYRSLDSTARAWIRDRGGIAEIMMRGAHEYLSDAGAIWGYVGDKQAEAVDRRLGFTQVAEPCLFVFWQRALSEEQKQHRIAEAIKVGPF